MDDGIARRRCKPFFIRHALNGGEIRLPGTQYRLDGFQGATPEQYANGIKGTAYEFLGCYWHGCPECYRGTDRQKKTPRTNQSMNELHALTLKKQAYIESQGMKYVHIWECEFQRELHNQPSAKEFVSILDIQDRLEPRDSFFGGRTNATKLRYEVKEEGKVRYVDFTSLYPYVNKYCEYPLKEPRIITRDFKDIGQYFGIAKVKVLPPKGLYHPVLPQKCNGKLTFALCRTCAEIQSQKPCQCNDDARSMVGTWCTLELIKAREKGYKILKIYEVYHWDHTSQYDHHSGNGGIFEGYINLFLKIKQEASDWPTWVKTEEDAIEYLSRYFRKECVHLDRDNIKKNKAMRSLAKLLLNSFWGKFGQRLNMPQTSFFHEREVDKFFQYISDPRKNLKDFGIIADDIIMVTGENNSKMIEEDLQTNIFIATFTTCHARLKLYEVLKQLDERVLYYDTDSIIYVSKHVNQNPPLGDYLGELTDELENGDHIVSYVSGGPKQYAYQSHNGHRVCKIRGFSLNYTNSQLLNFDSMLLLITPPPDVSDMQKSCKRKRSTQTDERKTIVQTNPSKITRHKRQRKIYNRPESKHYKIVYSKRVIQWDTYDTLPYGY